MTVKITGWDNYLNEPTEDTAEFDDKEDFHKQMKAFEEVTERKHYSVCWTFGKVEVMS